MHNEFTAIIEPPEEEGAWFIASCPEIPEANGQGLTEEEARQSLADGITLVLEYRREEALRATPARASRSIVIVE